MHHLLENKLVDYCAAAIFGTIMAITVVSVFMRYIMSAPFAWMEEAVGMLFLWAIMLGSAAATRAGTHLSIDLLVSRLPKNIRFFVSIMTEMMTIVIMGTLGWYGYLLADQVKFKITNVLGISYAYIDYAVPAGALGIVIFSAANIVVLCQDQKRENS